jgi:peptide deformylase
MKATINGITVEGTPEEIVKYEQLRNQTNHVTINTVTVDGKKIVDKMIQNLKRSEGITATY